MPHEIQFPVMMPEDPSNFPAQVIKLLITDARYGEKSCAAAGAVPLQYCWHCASKKVNTSLKSFQNYFWQNFDDLVSIWSFFLLLFEARKRKLSFYLIVWNVGFATGGIWWCFPDTGFYLNGNEIILFFYVFPLAVKGRIVVE